MKANFRSMTTGAWLCCPSARELRAMPTLATGQADDLKIETADHRLWLSRCTVEDGAPCNNKVTVERRAGNAWIEADVFRPTDEDGPLERTRRRVAKYVAEGAACMAGGFAASARAFWRRAGTNYAIAQGLYDANERSHARVKARRGRLQVAATFAMLTLRA